MPTCMENMLDSVVFTVLLAQDGCNRWIDSFGVIKEILLVTHTSVNYNRTSGSSREIWNLEDVKYWQ